MPKKEMDEDRARRRQLLEQKRAARKQAAARKEAAEEAAQRQQNEEKQQPPCGDTAGSSLVPKEKNDNNETLLLLLLHHLPEDALHNLYAMLPAADLGRLSLTCAPLNRLLDSGRVSYLLTRLNPHYHGVQHHYHVDDAAPAAQAVDADDDVLCATQDDARRLWENALRAGGDTGRIVTIIGGGKNKQKQKQLLPLQNLQTYNQFTGYARFLEESVSQYSVLHRSASSARDSYETAAPIIMLPAFCQGRLASVSPEHSLCRVGGGGDTSSSATHGGCGPVSGVASWGVGRRGQLGHGHRRDAAAPARLRQGIGYSHSPSSLRIVQVAAGGGLVRVAHSLLLTATGRVLSFGTGQYGALGHGYSAAKQLPDYLRPAYVEGALANQIVTCVAAGELHSAAVTADGDVYTWGDGFCGQLGLGDKRPRVTPHQVTTGNLDEECVAHISCGSRHTLAVTEDGECFSWGLGHFGVLGRSYTPFEYDADAAVVALATGGGDHDEDEDDDDENDNDAAVLRRAQQQAVVLNGDGDRPPTVASQPRDAAAEELAAHLDLIANLSLEDSSDQCIAKKIDSLDGVRIVGSSAGHRHSLLLDADGALYSFGAGAGGCLGHGDTTPRMFPCRIQTLVDDKVRIRQMSAGVDMSMAVSTAGRVFAWGKTDRGRIGLGMAKGSVTLPRRVYFGEAATANNRNNSNKSHHQQQQQHPSTKAVDVECGYVHSLIIGLNGTVHVCGGVGVDGAEDGQQQEQQHNESNEKDRDEDLDYLQRHEQGRPRMIPDFNIWHRIPEPQDEPPPKKERWKKYGKYEVKGRRKMLSGED